MISDMPISDELIKQFKKAVQQESGNGGSQLIN